jgi:cold shock CspA family protein
MKKSSFLKGLFSLLFLVVISFTSNAMNHGTVKFFNESKGILVDNTTGEEVEFINRAGADLEIGDEVMFITVTNNDGEVIQTVVVEKKKGLNAVNVKLA